MKRINNMNNTMLDTMHEYITKGTLTTRQDCLHYCIGWLEQDNKKKIDIKTIHHIDNLYFTGILKN